MSDYLGNLAARTLAAPPLRPRVRMRFEPEAVAADAVAAPEPASPLPPIEAPREQRAVETPPRVLERERVREVVKPGRETTRVVAIEAAAAEPPQNGPREPEVIERVETIKSREVVEGEPLVRSVPRPARDVRSPRVVTNQIEQAPRPHRYDEEPPSVIAQEPQIRERLIERREPEALASPAPAEPSVQVSIGRIEIRATTAPPAQRRARGRTAMSIDDYIAKRDAKERR